MTHTATRGRTGRAARLTPSVLAPIAAAVFLSHTGGAHPQQASAARPTQRASNARPTLSAVTVRATKETQALRVKVDHFVTSVVARPMSSESLMRWDKPVCPLVAGMAREPACSAALSSFVPMPCLRVL